jgi:hypothetical protein
MERALGALIASLPAGGEVMKIEKRKLTCMMVWGCSFGALACSTSSTGTDAQLMVPSEDSGQQQQQQPGTDSGTPPANSPDAALLDTGVAPTACTSTNAFQIVFSPMYSAYDGVHTFQIPAIVQGVNFSHLAWVAGDPSMVGFYPDNSTGGVMITVLHSGDTSITAGAGGLCGVSQLHVTQAEESDWEIGNARYNDGVSLHLSLGRRDGGLVSLDGGSGPACTNCHGPTATDQVFKTVAHTPEQAGGFSDDDLVSIITQGVVPDGGYFDPTIVPYRVWQRFHQWSDITPDQQKGIITYLRSLTPTGQTGSSNFGGRGGRDGGTLDGNFFRPDAADMTDSGGPADAAVTD